MRRSLTFNALVGLALVMLLAGACNRAAQTPPPTDTTPTTGTTPVRVSEIDLGRSLNADKSINDNTNSFKPADTIYASVKTQGTATATTIQAKWTFQDGQIVNESTQTISPTGEARTEFHISKPDGWPVGKYKVEIMINGASAGTRDFEVKPS